MVSRVRQRRPDIRDGEIRAMAQEFGDTPPRIVLVASERIGRRSKPFCPDCGRMLGDAPREPARGLDIAARSEVSGGNSNGAKEIERIIGVNAARDLEALDGVRRVSSIDADPATAIPCPDTSA